MSSSPLIGLAVSMLVSVSARGGESRNWTRSPAVVEIDTTADIYAIGDIHGDYERLTHALRGAGLAAGIPDRPEHVQWSAHRSVFVVTGDMIDKGPRAVDVLRLLGALQASASSDGGRVVVLAGNHEAEFLADPGAPKGKEFAAQLTADGMRPVDVAACKGDLGDFLCSLPFAARVNDWFFSHAGNSAGRNLRQMTADLQSGFKQNGFRSKELIGDGSILEARLNGTGKGREVWIDAGMPDRDERQLLVAYTSALGVKHIAEGHVPSEVHFANGSIRNAGEMFQQFGLLFLIDTGMSRDVNHSHGAVLHITATNATAVCPDGRRTVLWDSEHQQSVGRAVPCSD
jgi:Calcineurin-like phosphoesterase